MKALNVHAPSTLLTPSASITLRQQRRKPRNATGAALRLRPAATKSGGEVRARVAPMGGLGTASSAGGNDAGARVDPADAGEARIRAAAV